MGVIAPHAEQAEKLRTLLRSQGVAVGGGGLLVGSTEQFQGLERRAIIISAVRSDPATDSSPTLRLIHLRPGD